MRLPPVQPFWRIFSCVHLLQSVPASPLLSSPPLLYYPLLLSSSPLLPSLPFSPRTQRRIQSLRNKCGGGREEEEAEEHPAAAHREVKKNEKERESGQIHADSEQSRLGLSVCGRSRRVNVRWIQEKSLIKPRETAHRPFKRPRGVSDWLAILASLLQVSL